MATTTINPGTSNTTRYYDATAISLPNSDWCIGMWYRPNSAATATRLWDTGGPSQANACYARVSHPAPGTPENELNFRFIANDGTGVPVVDVERNPYYSSGWASNSDFLLIVQRRSGNLELHVCEKGGTTYSLTPVVWTLGGLSSGVELVVGGGVGGTNLLQNPYGEWFFLSGSSLSTANINTLKAGAAITAVTATPTRYYKLRESNDPESDLGTAGAALDQNGTGWTTAGEFFAESGSSTTVNPTTGSIAIQGLAPSSNAFTNVRYQEVLINAAGSPISNRTGLRFSVWYSGQCAGAPDLSYSDMTTGSAGTASYSIASGSLVYGQKAFGVITDGGASLSSYTCGLLTFTYS